MLTCCAGALCTLSAGCQLAADGTRGVCAELTRKTDEKREFRRNWQLACTVWEDEHAHSAGCSADFAQGFKEGFVDYLDAGGTGQPPPLPPRRYLAFRYQTPDGYQAITDWFAGFRRGAAAAAESGYRKYVVIPSPLASGQVAPKASGHDRLPAPSTGSGPGFPPSPQPLAPPANDKQSLPEANNSRPPESQDGHETLPPLLDFGAQPTGPEAAPPAAPPRDQRGAT